MGHFGPKNGISSELGFTVRIFQRAKRYMEIILMFFLKKILIKGKWAILGPKMSHAHNFGSALRIFLKF